MYHNYLAMPQDYVNYWLGKKYIYTIKPSFGMQICFHICPWTCTCSKKWWFNFELQETDSVQGQVIIQVCVCTKWKFLWLSSNIFAMYKTKYLQATHCLLHFRVLHMSLSTKKYFPSSATTGKISPSTK